MANCLILLAAGFEPIEVLFPLDAMSRTSIKVTTAAVNTSTRMVESFPKAVFRADTMFDSVKNNDYDCIVVPGGEPGTENLAANADVISFIQRHNTKGKLIASICAAVGYVLAKAAGIMKGRTGCGYPGTDALIAQYGGTISNATTYLDHNILSSRAPGTSPYFAIEIVRYLLGNETAESVKSWLLI